MPGYIHTCGNCGAHMQIHERYLGRALKCTSCRTEFEAVLPEGAIEEAPVLPTLPDEDAKPDGEVGPFIVSWEDTGQAFKLALEVESLTRNFEVFNIVADLPHRKHINTRAKSLLGFQPKENFQRQWDRR